MFNIHYTIQAPNNHRDLSADKDPEENYWPISSVEGAVRLYEPAAYALTVTLGGQTTALHHLVPLGAWYAAVRQLLAWVQQPNSATFQLSTGYELPWYRWHFAPTADAGFYDITQYYGNELQVADTATRTQIAYTALTYLRTASQAAVQVFPHQFGQAQNPPPYYEAGYVERLTQQGETPHTAEDYEYFIEAATEDYEQTLAWLNTIDAGLPRR